MSATLVWLRRDLRLSDHPALAAAAERGRMVPVYIHAPEEHGEWSPGAASRWWLHHALGALEAALRERRAALVIRRGPALEALRTLAREFDADAVFWNRLYDPAIIERDKAVKKGLRDDGLHAQSFAAALLHEPWTIQTGNGGPYRAFTPFWRACLRAGGPAKPLVEPSLDAPSRADDGPSIDDLGLLPRVRWDRKLEGYWQPGESGAHAALQRFVEHGLPAYDTARNQPSVAGTSRLSPHLHFGEITPRQIWHAVEERRAAGGSGVDSGAEAFLSEVGWRDFAHHVLYHHPQFPDASLDSRFSEFPWRDDDGTLLGAWQRGETGLPMVDAGMRELWGTGWMHNRVRMVTGSLLVKNLRLPWQQGERWFWDTLVDADLASNSLGWQWVAGSGADAAPFFRVFNPVRQGERFDAAGEYVAQWLPELAGLPPQYRQQPWAAPANVRRRAGLRLGETYPKPVVDLKQTRREALEAFDSIKKHRG